MYREVRVGDNSGLYAVRVRRNVTDDDLPPAGTRVALAGPDDGTVGVDVGGEWFDLLFL